MSIWSRETAILDSLRVKPLYGEIYLSITTYFKRNNASFIDVVYVYA